MIENTHNYSALNENNNYIMNIKFKLLRENMYPYIKR